jgi:hypothetical protein
MRRKIQVQPNDIGGPGFEVRISQRRAWELGREKHAFLGLGFGES